MKCFLFRIYAAPRSTGTVVTLPVPIALHFGASNSSSTSMKGVEGVADKTTQMQQQALNLMWGICVLLLCWGKGEEGAKRCASLPKPTETDRNQQANCDHGARWFCSIEHWES